jgi:hypothetical protein
MKTIERDWDVIVIGSGLGVGPGRPIGGGAPDACRASCTRA